jgi:ATP-binding cassette subfamily C exporter for protease/lipase
LKRALLLAIAFSGVANLLMLVPTLYMLQVYDRVLLSRNLGTLAAVSLITLYLFAIMALAEWARSRMLVRVSAALEQSLSPRVFAATFAAQLRAATALPNRALADLNELRQFLSSGGATAVLDLPWSPLYLIVLFLLHPWLGIASLGFALVQLTVALVSHRNVLQPAAAVSQAQAQEVQFVQNHLRSAEAVHAMGMAPAIFRRARQWHGQFNAAYGRTLELSQRQAAFSRFVRYVQQSLILAVGTLLVIDSQISPASMIAANILMNRALSPIDTIIATWRSFVSARQARSRLQMFLRENETPVEASAQPDPGKAATERPVQGATLQPGAGGPGLSRPAVRVQGLVASVPGRAKPILNGLSFEVPAGSITLVMGPSGSGKSTLMRALTAAWPDTQGEVLLNGHHIEALSDEARAAGIGSMPQDHELFDGTIAENISRFEQADEAAGRSDPQIAEAVIAAARAAGLHEAILRLSAGYDTPVGAAGGALSGGQRQRIALARALYRNPSLLGLDEPNATLDDVGEAALIRALRERRDQGATVFVVSHNPQMVAIADGVLVLADGHLISHDKRPASAASLPSVQP